MDFITWCNRIIRGSFLTLLFFVPLVLTPWNYELFEFNKMILTYGLTVIIMGAWVTKMMLNRKISVKRTVLDVPILLFVISQLISSLFSMDPHVSWFGYYSRFNGGMLSIFSYVLLYYAFVSNWFDPDDEEKEKKKRTNLLIYTTIASAILVSCYGVLEHFGIDKNLWVQDVQDRVFSTLGQPNWLAAYLVALLPIGFSCMLGTVLAKKRNWMAIFLWGAINFLFFVTLLFTRSRSGLGGLAVADAIFWIGYFLLSKVKKPIVVTGLIIHTVFFLFIFFNGSYVDFIDNYFTLQGLSNRIVKHTTAPSTAATPPAAAPSGTLLEYGGTESGTIRKYVWEAAITGWKATQKTFFIGTGTETFAFAFFQYKPKEHNLTSEWDFLYNKAHNEYLNYLTTTGILGLGSYLLFLGVFGIWFTKLQATSYKLQAKENSTSTDLKLEACGLQLALFSGWVSILVTNFFGFSVVIIQLFLFLFPALIIVLAEKDSRRHFTFTLARIPQPVARMIELITVAIATIGIGFVVTMWVADMFFAQGYRSSRSGQLADAYRNLTQATILRPSEPIYYDELGTVLAGLSVASMDAQDVTAAAQFAQQSLNASDRSLAISPNNVNFWKTRTKIYFSFASVDQKFVTAALTALEKAYSLSPMDPKIAYNLAVLHGRLGENDKAIEILKQTIDLKPNYRDAYYALDVFYTELKQPELAKAILQEYLTKVDPNDKDFQDKLHALDQGK